MDVNGLILKLHAAAIHLADGGRKVEGGYCGDFLSFVMGKAPADCAWFTVMTNVNVCAVASLADVAAVVVCEGSRCDDALVSRARQQGINLLEVKQDIFGAVRDFLNESAV